MEAISVEAVLLRIAKTSGQKQMCIEVKTKKEHIDIYVKLYA